MLDDPLVLASKWLGVLQGLGLLQLLSRFLRSHVLPPSDCQPRYSSATVFHKNGKWLGVLQALGLLQLLGAFLRCHVFLLWTRNPMLDNRDDHTLSRTLSGLVCCKALAFFSFLVPFFDAMVFLLSFASVLLMLAL
jgi:hypothetical protein